MMMVCLNSIACDAITGGRRDACSQHVYGIVVRMQSEKGGKHHKPHIHALYGDYEIVVALDGEILEGGFPIRQRKMLEGWMAIHEDELKANWTMLSNGEGFFRIDPLK